jgi:hypothetical protein
MFSQVHPAYRQSACACASSPCYLCAGATLCASEGQRSQWGGSPRGEMRLYIVHWLLCIVYSQTCGHRPSMPVKGRAHEEQEQEEGGICTENI